MRPPLRDPDDTPDPPPTAAPADAVTEPTAPADLLAIVDPIPEVQLVDNPFGLHPRELLFVEAYCGVAEGKAAKAYELAGYKTKGGASRANASRMLTRPRIRAAIDERVFAKIKALRIMDGDEALKGITTIGRSDIRKLFPPEHWVAQLSDEIAYSIKSITRNKHGDPNGPSGWRIELYPKDHALEVMAKAGGKLKETVKIEHTLEEIMALANRPNEGTAA